jgi:hypothetical protein
VALSHSMDGRARVVDGFGVRAVQPGALAAAAPQPGAEDVPVAVAVSGNT